MAETTLPEGTDTIVSDAKMAGVGSELGSTDTRTRRGDSSLTTSDSSDSSTGTGTGGGVREAIKDGTDKLKSTASDRAMGFVSQGIERSSGALSNVSGLIGDTAANLDERLGAQYGDYARQAAQSIERAAQSLAGKDPEELIDDARAIVRKSPGIALAGAAILGFALVRVVKSGLDSGSSSRKSN
ncbi:hypothetical protein [Sphingomonas sp.]|uniref:hypothetical protein n=1 Tax=Sphingomonas sp. TaxID=28214 RepID=UPI0025D1C3B4|nr:hypothetical protein [Sphingomonas sp.]